MGRPKKKIVGKKKPVKAVKPKEPAAPVVEAKKVKALGPVLQTPRGMKDILPVDEKYWHFVDRAARSLADAHGFHFLETPIVEETALFVRGVGKQTDIVEKEMFSFVDRGGAALSLRPEGTAPAVRAYVNHGMLNLPQPVKLWYAGTMFRHERPQGGRLRQFHQWSYETIGDDKAIADGELVIIAARFMREVGLAVTVLMNSIGDAKCRPAFVEKIVVFFRARRNSLCETCKVRLVKNPLRMLDCKEAGCVAVRAEAPQITDHLCEDCKNHFMRVLEYLDDAEVSYDLNPYLVRGLDYYTRTVFEVVPARPDEASASQSALASGGRYDGLVELLGGRPTPAVGFSIGLERVIGRLKEDALPVPEYCAGRVFFAQLGEPAKKRALILFEELRRAGVPVVASFTKDSLKSQMEYAVALGVRYVVILGQKEIMEQTVIVRDMDAGVQETVDQKKLAVDLKKKLGLAAADETRILAEVKIPDNIPSPSEPTAAPPPRRRLAQTALALDEAIEEPLDPFREEKPPPAADDAAVDGLVEPGIDEVAPGDDLGPPAGLIPEDEA